MNLINEIIYKFNGQLLVLKLVIFKIDFEFSSHLKMKKKNRFKKLKLKNH
jgi:hypothetical protein